MYAYFKGVITEITHDSVVLECGGVGWLLQVTGSVLRLVQVGQEAKLYAYQVVREDGITLFGFSSKEEKGMFLRLITVSGIGPKSAAGILSALNVSDLALAIATGDCDSLTRAPGIGKKTAQRLVLELREKVAQEQLAGGAAPGGMLPGGTHEDALLALTALGFSRADAQAAIQRTGGAATTEELIRKVLKDFGTR